MYNAGRPCCGPGQTGCGVVCGGCDPATEAGGVFSLSYAGTVQDNNSFSHDIVYDKARKYWAEEPFAFSAGSLGEYSEDGVWNWDDVRDHDAEPKYKITSGASYYRYIFNCSPSGPGSYGLAILYGKGTGYASQEDADASTGGVPVFLDLAGLNEYHSIELPSSFSALEAGPGVEIQTDGLSCFFSGVGGTVSPFTGIDVGTPSVFVQVFDDAQHCCDKWCVGCGGGLERIGFAEDANGIYVMSSASFFGLSGSLGTGYSGVGDFFTDDLAEVADQFGNLVKTSGFALYEYRVICDPEGGGVEMWVLFGNGAVGGTNAYFNTSSSDVGGTIQHLLLKIPSSVSSCNPLTISFDASDGTMYAEDYVNAGGGDNVWAGSYTLVDEEANGYIRPLIGSATITIKAYPYGATNVCFFSLPVALKDMTLSYPGGSTTLHVGDDAWLSHDCINTSPNVPVGFKDAGQLSMVLFGLVPFTVNSQNPAGLRITILKRGTCPSNGAYSLNGGSNITNLYVPLRADFTTTSNEATGVVNRPFHLSWTPDPTGLSGTSQTGRQFLLDAGITEIVVTE